MQFVLVRGAAQEAALAALMERQQDPQSPDFHHWLSPEEFGRQFGPSDQDIQAITQWLTTNGFKVAGANKGRTVVDFSGTAGQVERAFHTSIHRYQVNGEAHWANASDPQIPAALAPVVGGVASLHNFRKRAQASLVRAPHGTPAASGLLPLFTNTNFGFYAVGPGDFATIYNVNGLWNATPAIDGSGQSIAVVGRTNIVLQDIRDFRNLFGLPPNDPQIILNGPDPGVVPGEETEADLDVQWTGAIARNAAILFVVSESAFSSATDGVDLSAMYIVDNDLAPVLSESFLQCEMFLGTAGNAFESQLWQQAAAEGITALLASGDAGSAGCDDPNSETAATFGLAVSGLSSTPYNVAVGGTDFDDANIPSQFWSVTNNQVTQASALSYIPEVPWNDSCAGGGSLTGCISSGGDDIVAAGGGVSSVYPQPSWQAGPGVPSGGFRNVPDVSLFASNGFNGSFYIICEADQVGGGPCSLSNFSFLGIGGTSASTPAFAGIMALVNQKTNSRQGNANYVLYKLAARSGNTCNSSLPATVMNTACVFYDVTKGTNSVPCEVGSANCSRKTGSDAGVLVDPNVPTTPAWTAATGYDRATGLGSVNAANLAAQWSALGLATSSTALTLASAPPTSPLAITHGQAVTATVTVSGASGTPTGTVSLLAAPAGSPAGFSPLTLTNGTVTSQASMLPGGTSYNVTAHYPGDGTYGPSDSPPVTVTVNPEPSKSAVRIVTFNPSTGSIANQNAVTFVYGSPYILRGDVTNAAGVSCFGSTTAAQAAGCPTGTVTLTDNGAPLDGGTFTLNSQGFFEDQPIQLTGSTHSLVATYGGDNSFTPSTSSTNVVTVTPAATQASTPFTIVPLSIVGSSTFLGVQISTHALSGAAPTGTVTFFDGASPLSGTVTLFGSGGTATAPPSLAAQTNVIFQTGGSHTITARYSGDSNYQPATSAPLSVTPLYSPALTVNVTPASVNYGQNVTITIQATTNIAGAPPMTGQFNISGPSVPIAPVTGTPGTDASGNPTLSGSVTFTPQGSGFVFVQYAGDANYTSAPQESQFTVNIPDFTVGAGSQSFTLPVGQTGTLPVTITPATGMSSPVTLTCAGVVPVGYSCTLQPPMITLANGAPVTVMLTLAPGATGGSSAARRGGIGLPFPGPAADPPRDGVILLTSFAAGLLALTILMRRGRRAPLPSAVCLVVALAFSGLGGCGGSSSGGGVAPPPVTRAATTTTLTASPMKTAVGQPITYTATVAGQGIPTGNVNFTIGTLALTMNPLSNGATILLFPLGDVGITPVRAAYLGDGQNLPSMSATVNVLGTGTVSLLVSGSTGTLTHTVPVTATLQ